MSQALCRSLLIVLWLTLYDLPMSVRFSPASRRAPHYDATGLSALPSFACAGSDQVALKLGQTAQDRQHQPAVLVSTHVCRGDLKPAPFSATSPSRFNRSRVDLASRSSRVTTSTSPLSIAALSCLRSAAVPLIFS
jgi:hypothetical protein